MQVSAASIGAAALTGLVEDRPASPQESKSGESQPTPIVKVTLSDAAKTALAGGVSATDPGFKASAATAGKAVDDLLSSSGSAIYAAAINSLKSSPANLASQLDNPKLADADRKAISDQMIAREKAAFGTFTDGVDWAKKYVAFYDSLSPEEQNSQRYRGTRESTVAYGAAEAARLGQEDPSLAGTQDPILKLFDKIKQQNFNVDDADAKSLLQDYKDEVAKLDSSRSDPAGAVAKVMAASDRFNAVQAVIDQARSGDSAAFAQLQTLADDPKSIDAFVAYAQSLTVPATTSA